MPTEPKTENQELKTPRPLSAARIAANRANARKSTGPRTRRGKNRSRRNALKHGLLADQILINDGDPNEAPEQFEELLNHVLDHFEPEDPMERLLVERLAVSYWRLRRALRYETTCIKGIRYPTDPITQALASLNPPTNPYNLVIPGPADMNHLRRYSDMIYREINQVSRQLDQLRAAREAAERNAPTPTDLLQPRIPRWLEGARL